MGHYKRLAKGKSVVKTGGTFTTYESGSITQDIMTAADSFAVGDSSASSVPGKYCWLGGKSYEVSSSVRTELTNAGYA